MVECGQIRRQGRNQQHASRQDEGICKVPVVCVIMAVAEWTYRPYGILEEGGKAEGELLNVQLH